jgi:secondary thiamine-phosphate synthase enzyme
MLCPDGLCDPAAMKTTIFEVHTGSRPVVLDITRQCDQFAHEASGRSDGLLHVFVPHATAGVALLELGAGSDYDRLAALDELLPADDRWRHAHGSRGHGRSHVLPALVPPYATIPVVGGRMALGTWQSVALVDLNTDNPDRQVRLSFLS